ncbi:hypothetical protein [Pantoea sp. 18069]|uniref:hypothetical protein n=1 Tax=Pantoea sp. 18069 TaxID=2681415 RepID=UPI00135C2D7D|nr:hypothetical protein [Pantoea sp. 18069]
MDWTPLLHALIAVACQVAVGLASGNWWLGAALACTWWMAREHTQAEYRWIAQFTDGKRIDMPWWGGFDSAVWTAGSVLDWVVPAGVCLIVWAFMGRV